MGKLEEFLENKELLKLAIMDYKDFEIDIVHFEEEYFKKYWKELLTESENGKVDEYSQPIFAESEFFTRLYQYLWTPKVSELLIILYLKDLKSEHPTIWDLNNLLKRNDSQYPATNKAVNKLKRLGILDTEPVKDSPRNEKKTYINKKVVTLYGDDEFRKMMLDEWNDEAKEYMKRKLEWLLGEKAKFEDRIKMIKKRG
ncbi:hypothetical protein COY26_03325 [Candidatus Woesearchaeota archaeon CG_4_10_14_0_2_um_filter_33_10]|nr:MAG: hypothetical protein COY26_03325 [Candidatus Woesearchaeota archaeon CG_4_10_14_0_2_um_filter_33_10]